VITFVTFNSKKYLYAGKFNKKIMKIKEMIAYVIGIIVILIGAFGGKDLSNMDNIVEGMAFIMLIVSIYLMFLYMNKNRVGDWNQYK